MKQPIFLQLLCPLKVILQLLQNRRKNDVSTFNYKIEEKNLFVVLYWFNIVHIYCRGNFGNPFVIKLIHTHTHIYICTHTNNKAQKVILKWIEKGQEFS